MNKQRLTSVSLAVLTLSLLPLAAACGSEKSGGGSQTVGAGTGTGAGTSAGAGVTGVHWVVDDLTVDGKKSTAPAGAFLKIDKSGKVSGNYGCNGFGATAKIDGDAIDLSEVQPTEKGCVGDRMTFETALSKALASGTLIAKTDTGAKGGSALTITTKSGDTIHLS